MNHIISLWFNIVLDDITNTMYRANYIIRDAMILFVFTDLGCDCVPKREKRKEVLNLKHIACITSHTKYFYIAFRDLCDTPKSFHE